MKILKKLLVPLTLLMFLIYVGEASDGVSIQVSCSIPAIPGVNAPLDEEVSRQGEVTGKVPPSAETENELHLVQAENPSSILETVYSR